MRFSNTVQLPFKQGMRQLFFSNLGCSFCLHCTSRHHILKWLLISVKKFILYGAIKSLFFRYFKDLKEDIILHAGCKFKTTQADVKHFKCWIACRENINFISRGEFQWKKKWSGSKAGIKSLSSCTGHCIS